MEGFHEEPMPAREKPPRNCLLVSASTADRVLWAASFLNGRRGGYSAACLLTDGG